MGVKQLNSFIKHNCYKLLEKKNLCEFKGKTIVIDASIYMYKFLEDDLLIENIYLLCSIFRSHNIIPIFVFTFILFTSITSIDS